MPTQQSVEASSPASASGVIPAAAWTGPARSRLTPLERGLGFVLTCVWQYLFWFQPGVDKGALVKADIEWWPGVPELGLFRRCVLLLLGTPALVCGCYYVLYHFEFAWAERYRVEGAETALWNDTDPERRKAYYALNRLAFKQLLKSQTSLLVPITGLFIYWYIKGYMTPAVLEELSNPPESSVMVVQLMSGLFFFESAFYWGHRMQHRFFYRWHKQHHEYKHPNVLTSAWGSDQDGWITAIIPGLIPIFVLKMHFYTIVTWKFIHLTHTYVDHAGYEFPFNPFQLIPFSNHVRAHDFHHTRNVCNYGLYWRFWDWVMGTDKEWRAYENARVAGATADTGKLKFTPTGDANSSGGNTTADNSNN